MYCLLVRIGLAQVFLFSLTAVGAVGRICGQRIADAIVKGESFEASLPSETWVHEGQLQFLSKQRGMAMSVLTSLSTFFQLQGVKFVLVRPNEQDRMIAAAYRSKVLVNTVFLVKQGADFDGLVGDFVENSTDILELYAGDVGSLIAAGVESPYIASLMRVMERLGYEETHSDLRANNDMKIVTLDWEESPELSAPELGGFDKEMIFRLIVRGFGVQPTARAAFLRSHDANQYTEATSIRFLSTSLKER